MIVKNLREVQSELEKTSDQLVTFSIGDKVQFVAKPNRLKTDKPIFVREDGKVGFSNLNSIPYEIGDTIRGVVKLDTLSCFFVEVQEIIKKAPSNN